MTDVRQPLKKLFTEFLMLLDTSYSANDIIQAADDALDDYETYATKQWQTKKK